MKKLFTALFLALMICPVILAGGCQQCAASHPAVAPTYRDNVDQNSNDNGSEWYGSDVDSGQ